MLPGSGIPGRDTREDGRTTSNTCTKFRTKGKSSECTSHDLAAWITDVVIRGIRGIRGDRE